MKRAGLLVVAALLLGLGWLLTANGSGSGLAAPSAPLEDQPCVGGGHGPLTVVAPPGPSVPADPGSFSPAQARVYAALGEVADERREQLPVFDADSRAMIEPMRRLLAAQPLRRGEARPTITPGGATSTIAGYREPLSAKAVTDGAEPIGTKHIDASPPMTVADGAHQLALGAATGTVTLGSNGHIISGRDAWAAIKAKPGQGLPIRITDHGEGGHVIAVFGDDFGTVRVNGGLVVPGRYYLINGNVEITGQVPLGIHIRPLSAVPSFHDQPLMAPSANG